MCIDKDIADNDTLNNPNKYQINTARKQKFYEITGNNLLNQNIDNIC